MFINNLLTGDIPRRLIIGFVKATAFSGHYIDNPFNFQHYNVSSIELRVGGREITPLKMDFANSNYGMAYMYFLTGIGLDNCNKGIWISYKEFSEGNCLFIFDLTPDGCDTDAMGLIRSGTVNVKLTFNENLAEPNGIEMISYAEFDGLTEIDINRSVHTDY